MRLSRSHTLAPARVALALAMLLDSGMVMAQQCRLSAPLTLKETQDGVIGSTGKVWTIAADCSFTIARQIGFKTLTPDKRGELTPEQAARLENLLDRVRRADLPKGFGAAPHANPRRITLTYRETESVLTLPPGGAEVADERAQPVLELVAAVKNMLGG